MTNQPLSPLARYEKDIQENGFSRDEAQLSAIKKLDALYLKLIDKNQQSPGILDRLLKASPKQVKGLYLWGGVGRGKTYLMDIFFEALPFKKKKRLHFHRFMYWVHSELKLLDGKAEPLVIIAKKLAEEAEVLCFDEFFVSDITDAMILALLLETMFDLGISFVATSNIIPDELYRNGLQRSRFLPAIELINRHSEVLNVDGGVDYRLRTLEKAEIYHSPLDIAANENLESSFNQLAIDEIIHNSTIFIHDREIFTLALADGIVWLDYQEICAGPRSARDYIEFSKLYQCVFVSDIPQLNDDRNDEVRRFISMVDEFYERNVKLIVSAAVPLLKLYCGKSLAFEFKRTVSRLEEMQSHSYLAKQHLP